MIVLGRVHTRRPRKKHAVESNTNRVEPSPWRPRRNLKRRLIITFATIRPAVVNVLRNGPLEAKPWLERLREFNRQRT